MKKIKNVEYVDVGATPKQEGKMMIFEIAHTLPQPAAKITQAGLEAVPERILIDTIQSEDVQIFTEEKFVRITSKEEGLIVPTDSLAYIKWRAKNE